MSGERAFRAAGRAPNAAILQATRVIAVLVVTLSGACSLRPMSDTRAELLHQAFEEIGTRFYGPPVTARDSALGSLRALARLDDSMTVSVDDRDVVLRKGTTMAARFARPLSPDDAAGWGLLVSQVADALVREADMVGVLGPDVIDDVLLEGAISGLDRFSRYAPPSRSSALTRVADNVLPLALEDEQSQAIDSWPPAASASLLDDGLMLVRVNFFSRNAGDLLRLRIASLTKSRGNPRAIILDLRGNTGGLVIAGVDVADLFLSSGVIASLEGRGELDGLVFHARPGPLPYLEEIPMVVLIDGGSMSSTELVAAALQENGRAIVVGTSSFGKGSAQAIVPLINKGSLVVTQAIARTPSGRILHGRGVSPNVCTIPVLDGAADATATTGAFAVGMGASLVASWQESRSTCPPRRNVPDAQALGAARRLLLPQVH
jgi:Peptidase family S41